MHINIQASGFELTEGLRQHTERRLSFALGWANRDVRKIAVRLFDVNGPRGGEDKCCRIQVTLPKMQDVVIEDTEANIYVAIDRAADRAERSVGRRLERQREHQHSTLKMAAPDDAGSDTPDAASFDEISDINRVSS
ncbi:MAG: 30S ribosomal protein S30 [Betaproteobacteria bacterium HGW-Betaproteobacteria-10]|nr:MAG: 30S ribosomal protein S30 [Betaproteobacteria bacterium HGW-Betaproteobacteria-10]